MQNARNGGGKGIELKTGDSKTLENSKKEGL
jgi:hypothetical protein